MPFKGKIEVYVFDSTQHISVWDGCDGVELGCVTGTGTITDLNDSTAYWLRYAGPLTDVSEDSFSIQAIMSSGIFSPLNEIEELVLFPNPTEEKLQIEWKSKASKSGRLILIDQAGRIILQRDILPGQPGIRRQVLQTTHLPSGIYQILIKQGESRYAGRFVRL